MKLLIVSALLSLSVSLNAAPTMILFQPAITAASDTSNSNQQPQQNRVEKTDPVICHSTSLTKDGLAITLTKRTTTFKLSLPIQETYKVYSLVPNLTSLRNEQSGYSAIGRIQGTEGNVVGEFSLQIEDMRGKGLLLLAYKNAKEVVQLAVRCSKVNGR